MSEKENLMAELGEEEQEEEQEEEGTPSYVKLVKEIGSSLDFSLDVQDVRLIDEENLICRREGEYGPSGELDVSDASGMPIIRLRRVRGGRYLDREEEEEEKKKQGERRQDEEEDDRGLNEYLKQEAQAMKKKQQEEQQQ